MSAADLFKDPYDVEFRLKGTFIMIGREPYFVKKVVVTDVHAKNTILYLDNGKDELITVALGRLPLSAMTACPWGYSEGLWWARGPARHRYQGITSASMWHVSPSGTVNSGGVDNCKKLLRELAAQPKTRRPGKRPQGILTRDVYIDRTNGVFVRGRYRGKYMGENTIEPLTEISPLTAQLLANAKLTTRSIEMPKAASEKELMSNPCAEIIL